MQDRRLHQLRVRATLLITLLMWGLLLWQHLHEGVPSHSFNAREDMPAISNWWGALLVPALTSFLLGRIRQRLMRPTGWQGATSKQTLLTGAGFAGALLFGATIAALFTAGQEEATSHMATALLPLALLFPIYRAEYVLGFVLGMTFTFGAVLPIGFASLVALAAAAIGLPVRHVFRLLRSWVGGKRAPAVVASSSASSFNG